MRENRWSHALCDGCYQYEEPFREPVRMKPADPENCCRCGKLTFSGIYYRKRPEAYKCNGLHV